MAGDAAFSTTPNRGVYWARYTKHGRPIAYAVNSRGDVVRRLVVMHDSRAQAAVDYLWNYLDLVDPIAQRPPLRLVTSAPALPSTARRVVVEDYDPYNLPPLPGVSRRN